MYTEQHSVVITFYTFFSLSPPAPQTTLFTFLQEVYDCCKISCFLDWTSVIKVTIFNFTLILQFASYSSRSIPFPSNLYTKNEGEWQWNTNLGQFSVDRDIVSCTIYSVHKGAWILLGFYDPSYLLLTVHKSSTSPGFQSWPWNSLTSGEQYRAILALLFRYVGRYHVKRTVDKLKVNIAHVCSRSNTWIVDGLSDNNRVIFSYACIFIQLVSQ